MVRKYSNSKFFCHVLTESERSEVLRSYLEEPDSEYIRCTRCNFIVKRYSEGCQGNRSKCRNSETTEKPRTKVSEEFLIAVQQVFNDVLRKQYPIKTLAGFVSTMAAVTEELAKLYYQENREEYYRAYQEKKKECQEKPGFDWTDSNPIQTE